MVIFACLKFILNRIKLIFIEVGVEVDKKWIMGFIWLCLVICLNFVMFKMSEWMSGVCEVKMRDDGR